MTPDHFAAALLVAIIIGVIGTIVLAWFDNDDDDGQL